MPGEVEALDLDREAVDPHTRGAALDPTSPGPRDGTGMGMALRSEDITLTTTE